MYIQQLEQDKFVKTLSGAPAIRVKFVDGGVLGISQKSVNDREKAKFSTGGTGATAVKVVRSS